ncbi:hypothetical protein PPYR_03636 [Photinus pyralis]|uniref:LRRCT domain-containing protein n=1 Tax=Photinus pyralis TaxID=7054 RepID=A0A5N4A3E6_PHOPY|nr:hypothetical protein PPYR_03636 [Photinus pyralis]
MSFEGHQSVDVLIEAIEKMEGKETLTSLSMISNNVSLPPAGSSGLFEQTFPLLEYLYINNNQITRLNDGGFSDLNRLRYLELKNNGLTELETGAFTYLPSLFHLNLSDNKLEVLQNRVFEGLERLGVLILNNNEIKEVEGEVFRNLHGLVNLELANNQIEALNDGVFQDLENLAHLVLRYNKLQRLDTSLVAPLKKLIHLDMSHNQISKIPENFLCDRLIDGYRVSFSHNQIAEIGTCAFRGLVIRDGELDLGHNQLKVLKAGSLSKVEANKVILSHNSTETIENGAFEDCACTELHLDNNNLAEITSQQLKGLKVNRHLRLSRNRIVSFEGAFVNCCTLGRLDLDYNQIDHLPNSCFDGLENLILLLLNHNSIKTIQENSFSGLPKLYTIFLIKNQIQTLHPRCLRPLENLEELLLCANKIRALPDGLFDGNTRMHDLNLHDNHLTEVPPLFGGIATLRKLDLGFNKIREVPRNSFATGTDRKALSMLNLAGNANIKIEPGAFEGLDYVKYLVLSSINVKDVAPDTFRGLGSVHRLELDGNLIASPETLRGLPPTKVVLLENNPLEAADLKFDRLGLDHIDVISFEKISYQRGADKWSLVDKRIEDVDETYDWCPEEEGENQ